MSEQQASAEQTSSDDASQADAQQDQSTEHQTSEPTSTSTEAQNVTDLPAWAQKQIRDARKDAEKYRKRVQDHDDAQKTEAQRQQEALKDAEQRATDAEQKYRDVTAKVRTVEAAIKQNAVSPNAVYALIREDLTYDDNGAATNIDALIAQAKADEPQLFKFAAGGGDGGKRGETPDHDDFNSMIRRAAGRKD